MILNSNVGFMFIGKKTIIKWKFFDFSSPLVITFSPAKSTVKSSQLLLNNRDMKIYTDFDDVKVWGYDFLVKKNINVLSFGCVDENHWYRDKDLISFIKTLKSDLLRFNERLGYGVSMGGFGVSAFSEKLLLDRMLLISPISTLNEELVDFETRFKHPRTCYDWSGEHHDGANTNVHSTIIFDPLYSLDALHAKRYINKSICKFCGVGHDVAHQLQKAGLLNEAFNLFFCDRNVSAFLQKNINKVKRKLPRYYKWMMRNNENIYLTDKRRKVIQKYYDVFKVKYLNYTPLEHKDVKQLRAIALRLEGVDLSISNEIKSILEDLP